MKYDFLVTVIFLIVLISIQLTLNKILIELKRIKEKIDINRYWEEKDRFN